MFRTVEHFREIMIKIRVKKNYPKGNLTMTFNVFNSPG